MLQSELTVIFPQLNKTNLRLDGFKLHQDKEFDVINIKPNEKTINLQIS